MVLAVIVPLSLVEGVVLGTVGGVSNLTLAIIAGVFSLFNGCVTVILTWVLSHHDRPAGRAPQELPTDSVAGGTPSNISDSGNRRV